MYERRLLFAQFITAAVFTVFAWIAVTHFLYWRIWWFDIPMHVMGGFWAALCAAWLSMRQSNSFSLIWCLLFALVVAISWEIFEYSEGITNAYHFKYPTDTFKDVAMGLVGGILGWAFARLIVPGKTTLAKEG